VSAGVRGVSERFDAVDPAGRSRRGVGPAREIQPTAVHVYGEHLPFGATLTWIGDIGRLRTLAVREHFSLVWPGLLICLPVRWILRF
jgi:hypothetical protein